LGSLSYCSLRKLKGYLNERYHWYIEPDTPVVRVQMPGSINPAGGTTPREFESEPLQAADIKLINCYYPPPKESELRDLISKGVQELARKVPGRFCPEPPLSQNWLSAPDLGVEDIVEILNDSEYIYKLPRLGQCNGKIKLKGSVIPGLRQRAFFVASSISFSRLKLFVYPSCEKSDGFDTLVQGDSFNMGHHEIKIVEGALYIWRAYSEDYYGHERAQALFRTYGKATLSVKDLVEGGSNTVTVRGSFIMVHWPMLGRLD